MKSIFLLLFCFFNLFALEWYSYDEAVKLQKINHKVIMLDFMRTNCHYCTEMEKEVFHNKAMSKWIQRRFIPVKINLDFDDLPIDVKIKMTPTFYFLDKNQNILKSIPGSWNIKDFKDLTKKVGDK